MFEVVIIYTLDSKYIYTRMYTKRTPHMRKVIIIVVWIIFYLINKRTYDLCLPLFIPYKYHEYHTYFLTVAILNCP